MNEEEINIRTDNNAERIMLRFESIVNDHPDMNVRMRWVEEGPGQKEKNDPDFWLGVAYSAYQKKVISGDMFKEILLALKVWGAKSSYFKAIVQQVIRGDIK